MEKQSVLILDLGGQYNQLIARRIRELNVYCELTTSDKVLKAIEDLKPSGIILAGSLSNTLDADLTDIPSKIFKLNIPVLGICYGFQLMAKILGGQTCAGAEGYAKQPLNVLGGQLFKDIPDNSVCWINRAVCVKSAPSGFTVTASTADCPVAAAENKEDKLYCVQFHPEVLHTEHGAQILKNFLYGICGLKGDWTMASFAKTSVDQLKQKLSGKKVLCALSGGVDSAVCAALVHKACGDNLICVFVDHGLMRKDEAKQVIEVFKNKLGMNLIALDSSDRFLTRLKGVTDPETKRKIIGEEFIRVFEEQSKKIGAVDFLVQGTIYPDIVESGIGKSAVIKSHHNVGGLPDVIDFKEIIEPVKYLFKDEVRALGFELGLDESIVMRQPFPGPGLAVRVIGEITREKLDILREADFIFREEIKNAGMDKAIWQFFAVLTGTRTVGVTGDARTYDYTVALRAITSTDAMTADWARIPYHVLAKISARIVNEVEHVSRVVYDVTTKPPATIEWE